VYFTKLQVKRALRLSGEHRSAEVSPEVLLKKRGEWAFLKAIHMGSASQLARVPS